MRPGHHQGHVPLRSHRVKHPRQRFLFEPYFDIRVLIVPDGLDLLELEAHGLDAVGWDPAYRPDGTKRPSDLVNLGFVINVIEDREERCDALRQAFSFAKRILVVSVMLGGEAANSVEGERELRTALAGAADR